MTLLLDNEDVAAAVDPAECVQVLEAAYQWLARGRVFPGNRADLFTGPAGTGDAYNIKVMTSAYEPEAVSAVRLTSDVLVWRDNPAGRRREKLAAAPGGRWTGLVLLFSIATGEPLMICPDGVLQRLRVGATSALAARRMARESASRVAVLGSGWQARGHAQAIAAVLPLKTLSCFSPDPARRSAFVREMSDLADTVRACDDPRDAIAGADVVLCVSNSMAPILQFEWLTPGQHVGSIREGELPPDLVQRATAVVVHDRDNLSAQRIQAAPGVTVSDRDTVAASDPAMQRALIAPDLAELVGSGAGGRRAASDLTVFLNHHGMALQFAAVGAAVLRSARARGLGRELPTDWFTQDVHP